MHIYNVYVKIDEGLLSLYTQTSMLYQDVTGKNKTHLEALNHAIGSVAYYSVASVDPGNPASRSAAILAGGIGGTTLALRCIGNYLEAQFTERVPPKPTEPITPVAGPITLAMGLTLTCYGVLCLFDSLKRGDIQQLNAGRVMTGAGVGTIGLVSGIYFDRVDIEPPSGKSLFDRFKDRIQNLPNPFYQPKPEPVPV